MSDIGIKIGDVFKDTDAYGTVTILDVYISPTSGNRCYLAKAEDGSIVLCEGVELT